jgi:catechol 2,3-dioxygenase-like lactoylglutathione lyase family enzyme
VIDGVTAYAHVADVQRSVDFYALLGLSLRNTHEADGGLVWAFVAGGEPDDASAGLMLALASGPVDASAQAVLFYCWTPDVASVRDSLVRAGVEVGAITHPFYMPFGEVRVLDPDGYVVLVGQREAL